MVVVGIVLVPAPDPPLGPPWEKHECMHPEIDGFRLPTLAEEHSLPTIMASSDWIFGTISWASTSSKKRVSCVRLCSHPKSRTFIVQGNAQPEVGSLAIVFLKGRTLQCYRRFSHPHKIIGVIRSTNLGRSAQRKEVTCPDCGTRTALERFVYHLTIFHKMKTD